jgi:hypothetical protein
MKLQRYKEFERVRWYSGGKLEPPEESDEKLFELEIGDKIKYTKNAFVWWNTQYWKEDYKGETDVVENKQFSENIKKGDRNTPPVEEGEIFYKLKKAWPWMKIVDSNEIEILKGKPKNQQGPQEPYIDWYD